jgi:hypothetical protein
MTVERALRKLIEAEHARTVMVGELILAGYTATPIKEMLGISAREWGMALERLQRVLPRPTPWTPRAPTTYPTHEVDAERPTPPVRISHLPATAEAQGPTPKPKPKRRPKRPPERLPPGWTIT